MPEEFKLFWDERKNFDAILGKRPNRQDGMSRKFIENVLRLILKIIFGVSIPDANAPFRLMSAEILKKYLPMIPENFNLPNVILTTYFKYFDEKIKFIGITFRPRRAGKSFVNVKSIMKIGFKAVKDFYVIRRNLNHV